MLIASIKKALEELEQDNRRIRKMIDNIFLSDEELDMWENLYGDHEDIIDSFKDVIYYLDNK